ncbi:MAG: dihydrolipoamide acetyltransferase family protein [Actinomycetota bacterium]
MATEIKMPQLGESVVEGTITKWLKQEGDDVDEDELLVEVSTDKVDSEVPSSAAGKIQKILVQEGETVKVGTAIAVVGEGDAESGGDGSAGEDADEGAQEAEAQPQEQEEGDDEAKAEEEQGGDDVQDDAGRDDASEAQRNGDAAEAAVASERDSDDASEERDESATGSEEGDAETSAREKKDGGDTSKRGIISPLVRRLADEHGVDLEEVSGSGTGGRIRKQDVMKFVEQGRAKPGAKPAAQAEPSEEQAASEEARPARDVSGREELVPWTNIRRRTAEHMAASARETARAWNAVEADWTSFVQLRQSVKDSFKQREGFNLTYMAFLGRVICDTLLEMPEINATFDEENQANLVKHYVNLGIAVALEGGGLIVPVVKEADEKNLVGLARGINDIVMRARSKKLSPDDLTGGTFTITNPGPFGSVISVPIIPRGQSAILGFEAIQKRVVVTKDDAIAIRSMGFLSLSWDHRTIDGAEAARFLGRLKEKIETTDYSPDLSQYA